MNRVVVLVVALLSISFVSTAQNNSLGKNDPAAKAILDKVSKKFKSFPGVQVAFTLKLEGGGKATTNDSRKGTVYMKNGKYKVIMPGQEIISDGVTTWTYEKASNEVSIRKVDGSANAITPQKIFTNFYDKDFLYKLNGEKKQGGKVIQEIELTPVDKNKSFHKVFVYVDKAAQTITGTKILEKNGNKYTYTVNTFASKANLSDALFVFNKAKYPGVEEVDMRD